MMTDRKRLWSGFLIVILLLSQLSFRGYAENDPLLQTADRKVTADKVFTVRFNDIIDIGNLQPGNIRVTGEEGDVAISVENGGDGKSLIINPPRRRLCAGQDLQPDYSGTDKQ